MNALKGSGRYRLEFSCFYLSKTAPLPGQSPSPGVVRSAHAGIRPRPQEITTITNLKPIEMAYMSQKGYDELVAKLQHMESVDRPAASAAIAEARDKGDLSENAEYDAAKEWQSKLETQIAMLKQTILDAKIIDTRNMDTSTVQIMATVGLKNVKNGMAMKYTIVSATEADHRAGKISVETPIAQGLLGKKVGEVATICVPQGEIQLEVTDISYDA